ncbi:MAG: GNAT family N-acetyltransferase [Defluviitaleaceae bacterium]|nr:GNAT family N-acetyltransferase [Defluviitaleaceae bacterium]
MKINVRDMQESDIAILAEEFAVKQGWRDKNAAHFAKYFAEHVSGKRHVLVATLDHQVAGYVTLLPQDTGGPFVGKNIPMICDFNVLIDHRKQGVGTALMDAVEARARQAAKEICLAVGLYTDYGAALRMYVKRGYIPDGSGVWYQNRNLPPYENCRNDDDLVLYMSKKL